MKISVIVGHNPELSELIQKTAFAVGIDWSNGEKIPRRTDQAALFIDDDDTLSFSDEEWARQTDRYRLLTVPEFLKALKEKPEPVKIRLNSEYTATLRHGRVYANAEEIEYGPILELAQKVREAQARPETTQTIKGNPYTHIGNNPEFAVFMQNAAFAKGIGWAGSRTLIPDVCENYGDETTFTIENSRLLYGNRTLIERDGYVELTAGDFLKFIRDHQTNVDVRLNRGLTAAIRGKIVRVGCQTIEFGPILELADEINKIAGKSELVVNGCSEAPASAKQS